MTGIDSKNLDQTTKLSFIKTNPTENMTVFVLDPLPRTMYIDIAKKILDYNSIHAEQVGFLEKPSDESGEACVRLHMMGGEFCGNAARALAAVMVQRGNPKIHSEGRKHIVPLEVSGADEILHCEVEQTEGGRYLTTIRMPLHHALTDAVIPYHGKEINGTWVRFEGIMHLIVDRREIELKEEFFQIVKEGLKDSDCDAFGIMFYDAEEGYMEPLVYVRPTDSTVWERGCGSGTTAVGIYTAYQEKQGVDLEVRQPGGIIRIQAGWEDHEVTAVYLTGEVKLVAEGTLYL